MYINRFLHVLILCSFILTYSVPASAVNLPNVGVNELDFMYRVHKIVDKFISKKDKQKIGNMVDVVIELKQEIETSFNTNIDISQYLNQFESELKKDQKVTKTMY